jgi:PAS domain S-box-containing protein
MKPGFRSLLVIGFVLAVVVLALDTVISTRNIRRLAENNRRALRTAEALRDLESTLSTLKDAETGQRGYLLTGREDYLAPYESAVGSIGEDLRRLEGLLDDPDQRRRLGALEARIREKLGELKETVGLRQRDGLEAATRVVLSDRGRQAMDDIRGLVGEMEGTERALLGRRIAESDASLAWATTTFAVVSVAALLMVAALGVGVARHLASRRRSERALRDQLERWQVTLGSIGDAVIVTDGEGRVTFMNPVAESLCGRTRDTAAGRPLAEVFPIVNEESRQPVEAPVERVLREGVVVGLANHTVLIGADGTERPIHDSAAPIRDDQGRLTGVVLVFRDDTERRDRERELVEANRRKDEFLAMLAHELRNPLAAIRSAVETFGMPGTDDHDDWAKGVIVRQVEHLAHLLDDLLDVSRITRGLIQVRKQLIDAYPVINRAVESVRRLIDDRRQGLEVSIAPRPLRLSADPVRLEQVLVNLLTNASRYTPAGGHVRLSAEQDGDQIILRVADDGQGIAPEVLPRIFDLFTQGDRTLARSEGGLGVGLTIVRKLVDLHEGSVSARSEGPGRGSEFIVRLPAVPDQAADSAPTAAGPTIEKRGSRILIVDDNQDLAEGLARILRMLGHETEVAHDGPEGLEAARNHRPDVILLDIGLPRLDGYLVARTLRHEGFRDTLIIAISGYGQEEDRRRSLEAGMNHHLTKPVDIKTITELIAQPD